jgi:hypothetical protein
MHAMCFDQHCSSSGVSKIADETAMLLCVNSHDTIRWTTHHHREHGRIDEGISQKIKLTDESAAVSSAILVIPEDEQCWSKHVACMHL